jgi:TolA-binding protein
MLLGEAAQIQSALRKEHEAIAIWQRILQEFADSPEAPAADLGWARASQRLGDASTAVARLEHLILTYPQSALVPQARRELDLARRSIPGAG